MITVVKYIAGLRFYYAYNRETKKETLVRIEGEYLCLN